MLEIESVLSQVEKLTGYTPKSSGTNAWKAPCLNHEDSNPSMGIKFFPSSGYIALVCFKECCEPKHLLKMLRLNKTVWTPEKIKNRVPSADLKPWIRIKKEPHITYTYLDPQAEIAYQKVRFIDKTWSIRRPHPKYGWSFGLPDEPYLYNLPKVIRSNIIYLVEGEKDVNSLGVRGLVGTCNFNGAGISKWKAPYDDYLRGKFIKIIADNDPAGILYAKQLVKRLSEFAKVEYLGVLPNSKPKGDLTDWFDLGYTVEDLLALSP